MASQKQVITVKEISFITSKFKTVKNEQEKKTAKITEIIVANNDRTLGIMHYDCSENCPVPENMRRGDFLAVRSRMIYAGYLSETHDKGFFIDTEHYYGKTLGFWNGRTGYNAQRICFNDNWAGL